MNRSIVRTARFGSVASAAGTRPRPACAGKDPELFFAHGLSAPRIAHAKGICASCPLMASCLEGALERGEEYGVWGGLTEDERRELTRPSVRSAA
ncbi:WhiB family transcriptional regulator [Streptomyces sp. NPDC006649]|uniref:WhiB family transcriptional regulator n=1 Tax=Streptomyces sp. NPDC006649 TaxID=3156896 RepID=UPI0033A76DA4